MCEKDYRLLRPIDWSKLQVGDEVISLTHREEVGKVIVGPNSRREFTVDFPQFGYSFLTKDNRGLFKLAPLAWVEGKPVYKGDKLWYPEYKICVEIEGHNERVAPGLGLQGIVVEDCTPYQTVGELTWAPVSVWSWNKPKTKVKKSGWMNCYAEVDNCCIHSTKELADSSATNNRLDCVFIEWEQEE